MGFHCVSSSSGKVTSLNGADNCTRGSQKWPLVHYGYVAGTSSETVGYRVPSLSRACLQCYCMMMCWNSDINCEEGVYLMGNFWKD